MALLDLLTHYPDDEEPTPGTPIAAPTVRPMSDLVSQYLSAEDPYAAKLESALGRRKQSVESLKSLYEKALEEQPSAEPSKAELYFKLAQAFLDPGKTGAFTESLGRAGGIGAEYMKEQRLARRQGAADRLKAQTGLTELEAEAAGEEADVYQKLSERGITERAKLVDAIRKSGEPESSAGKQAADEGFKPGTSEFQARVKEIARQASEASEARVGALMANLDLARSREGRMTETMSPTEIKLLIDTEDIIRTQDSAIGQLEQALQYSSLAFNNTASEQAQYALTAERDPDNPRVVATRNLQNILSAQSMSQLKALFGGQGITDSERKALDALQGADAKSQKERDLIIQRGIEAARSRRKYNANRLEKIRSGGYRYRSGSSPSGQ